MRLANQTDLEFLASPEAQWRPSDAQIRRLIRRAQEGEKASAHRLVLAFTHMVAKISREPAYRDLPERAGAPDHVDLIQEGCAALMIAIDHFDPAKPGHFAGYAATAIRRRLALVTRTSQTSLRLPRRNDGTVPFVETPFSLDRVFDDDDHGIDPTDPRASQAFDQIEETTTAPQRAGLQLVFSHGHKVSDLASTAAAQRDLARKVQDAAHAITKDRPSLQVTPAPRGSLSETSFAIAMAIPQLQMKQQTLLHLAHTTRLEDDALARHLGVDRAVASRRLRAAETKVLALAGLSPDLPAAQLRRAVAAHSYLRERALIHLEERDAQIIDRRLLRGETTTAIAVALGITFTVARDRATAARKQLERHEARLLAMYRP